MKTDEIEIEATTACDAKCVMCPRDEYLFPFKSMTFELFKKTLDDAVANGVISVLMCGFGDVFMDKGLEKKLSYCRQTYPHIKLYTPSTCSRLTPQRLHMVGYLDTLKISMYGMSKESYEAVHRGSLKFESVWENIHNILEFRKTMDHPLYVAMTFLILPENQHEMDAWKKYWEPLVDEIQIWRPHNYGSLENHQFPPKFTGTKKSCGRPFFGSPCVHNNGDVSVCCFDNDHKLVIGNINQNSIADILKSDELERIRKVHREGTFDSSDLICKGCDQLTDRQDALVYTSNKNRKVGVLNGHPDLINDVLQKMDTLAPSA
jgi:radical SAM protein with 4Fe4S-binding SPASM domain